MFGVSLHTHHLQSLWTQQLQSHKQVTKPKKSPLLQWIKIYCIPFNKHYIDLGLIKRSRFGHIWKMLLSLLHSWPTLSPMLTLVKLRVCRWMLEVRMAGAMVSTSNFSRYWPIKGQACCRICMTEQTAIRRVSFHDSSNSPVQHLNLWSTHFYPAFTSFLTYFSSKWHFRLLVFIPALSHTDSRLLHWHRQRKVWYDLCCSPCLLISPADFVLWWTATRSSPVPKRSLYAITPGVIDATNLT